MTNGVADLVQLAEAQYHAVRAEYARKTQAAQSLRNQITALTQSRDALTHSSADPLQVQKWLTWCDQQLARHNTALAASLADLEPTRLSLRHVHGRLEAIRALWQNEENVRTSAIRKRQAHDLLHQLLLGR